MATEFDIEPLRYNVRIVNDDGTPNDYFIRWSLQRQIDIGTSISAPTAIELINEALRNTYLIEGYGITITGSIGDGAQIEIDTAVVVITTTEVIAGVDLDGGGALTSDITIDHATSGVVAGSYTNADVTVNDRGHITNISNGSGGGGGFTPSPPTTGTFAYSNGTDAVGLANTVQGGVVTTGNMGGFRTSRIWTVGTSGSQRSRGLFSQANNGAYFVNGMAMASITNPDQFIIAGVYCDNAGTMMYPTLNRYSGYGNNATEAFNLGHFISGFFGVDLAYDATADTVTCYITVDGFLWQQVGVINSVSTKLPGGVGISGIGVFTTSAPTQPFDMACWHLQTGLPITDPLPSVFR